MITHGTNIAAWAGVHLAQGEMVLLAPLGSATFCVAGRPRPRGATGNGLYVSDAHGGVGLWER